MLLSAAGRDHSAAQQRLAVEAPRARPADARGVRHQRQEQGACSAFESGTRDLPEPGLSLPGARTCSARLLRWMFLVLEVGHAIVGLRREQERRRTNPATPRPCPGARRSAPWGGPSNPTVQAPWRGNLEAPWRPSTRPSTRPGTPTNPARRTSTARRYGGCAATCTSSVLPFSRRPRQLTELAGRTSGQVPSSLVKSPSMGSTANPDAVVRDRRGAHLGPRPDLRPSVGPVSLHLAPGAVPGQPVRLPVRRPVLTIYR